MAATAQQRSQFISDVRTAAAALDGQRATITICPRGDHLRAARRWQATCAGCGQSIPTGAVGPVTWDDEHTCALGAHDFQHGCGTWNVPTEVATLLDDVDLDGAIQVYDDDTDRLVNAAGVGAADLIRGYAREVVDDLLDRLDAAVEVEQAEAAERVRERLIRDLAAALRYIEEGDDPADTETGSETQPGVVHEDGVLMAWDYDPRDPDGGTLIEVTADDLPREEG